MQLFPHQFPRYVQVLDLVNNEFAYIYSCIEGARFFDVETGNEYSERLLRKEGLYERLPNPPAGSGTRTAYKYSDKVRVEPVHKERVQVL